MTEIQRHIRKLFYLVLSFETVVALFLFAGVFKEDPRFSFIPMDITLFFASLTLLGGCRILVINKPVLSSALIKFFILIFLFHFWAGLSLLWTSSYELAYGKYFLMLANHIPAVFGGFIIASDPKRVGKFLFITFLLSIWVSAETGMVMLDPGASGENFLTVLGGGYQATTYVLGIGALIGIQYYFYSKKNDILKWGSLSGALSIFFILPFLGGRSSIVSLFACFLMMFILGKVQAHGQLQSPRVLFVRLIISFGVIIVTFIAITTLIDALPVGLKRLAGALVDPEAGGGGRLYLWGLGIQSILDNLMFGEGIGGFPVAHGFGEHPGIYPHNMFIEVYAELGIIGAILFLWLMFQSLKFNYENSDISLQLKLQLFTLVVYVLIITLTTGFLINKQLFYLLTLLFVGGISSKISVK